MGFINITSNLDEVKRNLEEKKCKIEELNGKHDVPSRDLFSPEFMEEYTSFNSINEMYHADGFKIESKEDMEKIPNEIWNEFISKHTQFADWDEMQKQAWKKYFTEKINKAMK